jgi:hypothetical protein
MTAAMRLGLSEYKSEAPLRRAVGCSETVKLDRF